MTAEAQLSERITRILELPKLLERAGRQVVAQRAERRTLERRIEAIEAKARMDVLKSGDPVFVMLKNQVDREAYHHHALTTLPDWIAAQERLESLTAAIEKAVSDKEALEHERKSLKAALEREYAAIIERALTDRDLVSAIQKNGKAMA